MAAMADDDDKIVNSDSSIVNGSQDLPDSPNDAEHLKSETVTMDLPDVKDIPGQEHVKVFPMGEMADSTASSLDEEGEGIEGFEDDEDDDPDSDTSVNVTQEEKDLLDEAGTNIPDDQQLKQADLDSTDEDGELLNEEGPHSGADLDVPGAEDDDADEETGSEDEENNDYSLPDTE